MLLAVLSSGPFLKEWEMEFTCIICQHLGLAGPYLFCWSTLYWGEAEGDIFGCGREENSVCESALKKKPDVPGVPKSLLLFIVLYPSSLQLYLILSLSSPPAFLGGHCCYCSIPCHEASAGHSSAERVRSACVLLLFSSHV